MQKGNILLHHRHEDAVVGLLLGEGQWLDERRPVFAAMVQPTYLYLIGFQYLALDELVQGFCRCLTGIHQFFFRD